jgi:diguanylate cyclase (GGDEF)-like protein/putative nucleotidyltransferase with HDIG domain
MKRLIDAIGRLQLRWKILLPFVVLSLLTWLVAAELLGRSAQQTVHDQGVREVNQVATTATRHLELETETLRGAVGLCALEGQLMLGGRSTNKALRDFGPDVVREFATHAAGGSALRADLLKIIDSRGRVRMQLRRRLLQTGALQDSPLVTAAREGTPIGGVVAVADQPVAYVAGAAPVDMGGPQPGVFLVGTSLSDEMLAEISPPSDHVVLVLGPDGVIAATGPESHDAQWATALAHSHSGEVTVTGTQYLVSSQPLRAPNAVGLRVFAARPTAPLSAEANAGRTEAWLVLGIGLGVFVAVALWLSARLTRPLRDVTKAAQTLANGDFSARAPVRSRDEIGELAAAFNTMGDELATRADRLAQAFDDLKRLSETDALTGLLNHRAVHAALHQETSRAQRHALRFSVAIIDIDNFKLINDTYGHPAGDVVIRQVATVLVANTRATDIVGRHGGDEFTVILPETNADEAAAVADKLRRAMHDYPMVTADGLHIPIRLSLGTAVFPRDGVQANELLACADANLYQSKRRGGDAVTCADHEDGSALERLTAGGFSMLDSLVAAVDNKDRYTRRHSEDVTRHALMVAEFLGLSDETQRVLRVAGLLHDVGKIGVPDALLRKPGRLTPREYEIVKHHAALGASIIQGIPDEEAIRQAIVSHHEHWDGTGFPSGTRGLAIPQLGRILAVADAYSAMTSDRPYRKALSRAEALEELRNGAGTQFDPQLVRVVLLMLCEDENEDDELSRPRDTDDSIVGAPAADA